MNNLSQRINNYYDVELSIFEKEHEMEHNIDPDLNFFNDTNEDCCYYCEDDYNQSINTCNKLTIIHFNARSLYTNFHNIRDYLQTFTERFNIIAITETWITTEKGLDFDLEGYEFMNINRNNKAGGGVAFYVDKSINVKIIENMTNVVDNLFECITIEISNEKKKNIIASCIYRAPGTDIDTFKDWMEKMYSKITNKTVFVCGDFNIDILNPHNNKSTDEFVNTMYSMSLFPKITRPTRITTNSATLIDNIYSNEMENKLKSGILINDITDHLPVFISYDYNYRKKDREKYKKFKRIRTNETINKFKAELLEYNWEVLYSENDVNKAYELFLNVFQDSYNKCCPIYEYIEKKRYSNCPWLTKGLQNACKKKNYLYKEYVRTRTKEAETKYKKYKNKLTHIIRTSKRDYYKRS